jgi:hypothetical protein
LLVLPGQAHAREWDLGVNSGIGAFFGSGWDANRPGASFSVAGGPRLHKYFSVHGMFLMEALRLRTTDSFHRNGEFFAWMIAPEVHPLGRRNGITPYITPLFGYSYEIGRVDVGAPTRFASRALVAGGMLGCTWPLAPGFALGANLLLIRRFTGKSCIQSDASGASCGALEPGGTRLGAAQVTFQMTFGAAKPPRATKKPAVPPAAAAPAEPAAAAAAPAEPAAAAPAAAAPAATAPAATAPAAAAPAAVAK